MNPDQMRLARTTDPITSHLAAAKVKTASKRRRLLEQFGWEDLTAEEAAFQAGYGPADGAWKRVSDLKRMGLIEPTGVVVRAQTGHLQERLRITEKGSKVLNG